MTSPPTRTVEFPSVELPAPPHLTMSVPETWETVIVPGLQVAVAEPAAPGRFRANVVVTCERLPAEGGPARAVEALGQRSSALPSLEEIVTDEVEIAGRPWLRREYGYTQPGSETVVQAVRHTHLDRGRAVDVIEVVGSCGAARADELLAVIRGIQDSVRVWID